jgi:uncharacterized protein YndB with AHSA1/START domain
MNLQISLPSDREVVHTRRFAAPPEKVFEALTEPAVLRRWYGPPGWVVVECEAELRAGGAWRIVTRKPDGKQISQQGVFVELSAPSRIVKTERWLDWDVGEVLVTWALEATGEGTLLTSTARYPSKDVRDKLIASGAHREAEAHYGKLEALLEGVS